MAQGRFGERFAFGHRSPLATGQGFVRVHRGVAAYDAVSGPKRGTSAGGFDSVGLSITTMDCGRSPTAAAGIHSATGPAAYQRFLDKAKEPP